MTESKLAKNISDISYDEGLVNNLTSEYQIEVTKNIFLYLR
jgi:hypothetical protein